MVDIYYECSDGTKISFTSDIISVDQPESLARNQWNYAAITGVGGIARIKRFYKEAQEAELTLEILADDAAQYNRVMEQMHTCFERDVRTMTPGKLWWGDFYKEIYVAEAEYDDFEELLESVKKKITVVSTSPYWTREKRFSFYAREEIQGLLDYPWDYGPTDGGFDYDGAGSAEYLRNNSIYDSRFQIIFYGPCINPQIYIDGHSYTLYTTLTDGETAVIDSRTKKITRYTRSGQRDNIFSTRGKTDYIFREIPTGRLPVTKADDLAVDVVIYDERGEPTWI